MDKLYAPSTVKQIIADAGFRFSKSLGQNFLIDEHIVTKIVDAMNINENDVVLEIGPGIGTITAEVAKKAKKVIAVEIDSSLIPILKKTLSEFDNVEVIHQDILKTDIETMLRDRNIEEEIKVIGNLPYYITTPIIMKFLEDRIKMESITTMVQKEVADRMRANPGKKDYGSLSVAVQYFCSVEVVANVPNTVFIPPPKVDSTVIKLTKRKKPPVELISEEMFFKTVRGGFQQRRKTLLNALSNTLGHDKQIIEKILIDSDVDPKRRAETLSIQEFATVANKLCEK